MAREQEVKSAAKVVCAGNSLTVRGVKPPINVWVNGWTFSTTSDYLRLILRLPETP